MKIIETEFTNEINACEYNLWDEEETKEHIDNCIKIADNHAIKFVEWLNANVYYEHLTKEFIYFCFHARNGFLI